MSARFPYNIRIIKQFTATVVTPNDDGADVKQQTFKPDSRLNDVMGFLDQGNSSNTIDIIRDGGAMVQGVNKDHVEIRMTNVPIPSNNIPTCCN